MALQPVTGDQGNANDQILEEGAILLRDFICERVRRHGDQNAVVTREQLGGGEVNDPYLRELMQCLEQIGNELDGNTELQRMINTASLVPSKDLFLNVAREIFSDGKFNWGRVVALFYFACRLVIRALGENLLDFITTVINWTLDYLQEHVVNWIREQGGWENIRFYFATLTWPTLAIFLAGVLTGALILRKM